MANLLSKAWGRDRFPIDVKLIAHDISARQPDPIARIHGGDIGELEGMLLKREKGWYAISISNQLSTPPEFYLIYH